MGASFVSRQRVCFVSPAYVGLNVMATPPPPTVMLEVPAAALAGVSCGLVPLVLLFPPETLPGRRYLTWPSYAR